MGALSLRFINLLILLLVAISNSTLAHPRINPLAENLLAGRDLLAATPTINSDVVITPTTTLVVSPSTCKYGCIVPPPLESLDCNIINGTQHDNKNSKNTYTIICDTDFPGAGQDIYPFYLTSTFDECLQKCDQHTINHSDRRCAGFVFAPERIHAEDDCYLKSSLEWSFKSEIHLIGGIMDTFQANGTVELAGTPGVADKFEPIPIVTNLVVAEVNVFGSSVNNPTEKYVHHPFAPPMKLANNVLVPGINMNLITGYSLAGDTGVWKSTSLPFGQDFENLSFRPRISRDGGKGGIVNGTRVFVFCDTANFDPQTGEMVGFVSSSVATDESLNGLQGNPLELVDHIGQWQDDVGRMRGFAQMTTAEQSFNIALSGEGYRYVVWPESSLIPINYTHSLVYAALVYDEVDMSNQAATFTELGNTLLVVTTDTTMGPYSERLSNVFFNESEIQFGTLGGFRAWGSEGIGGSDGYIYLFGKNNNGVMTARTTPSGYSSRENYEYWNGTSWIQGSIPTDSSANILNQAVMDFDLVYAPKFETFLMVYLTPDADNTFWFRNYLGSPIIPPYVSTGVSSHDWWAEAMISGPWSEPMKLYAAEKPVEGYVYAGSVHAGYFGEEDITLGGNRIMISWTEHTGQDAASEIGGYAHKTAGIRVVSE